MKDIYKMYPHDMILHPYGALSGWYQNRAKNLRHKRKLFFIQVTKITFEIDSKIGCGELVMIRYFAYPSDTFFAALQKIISNNWPQVFLRRSFKRSLRWILRSRINVEKQNNKKYYFNLCSSSKSAVKKQVLTWINCQWKIICCQND